MAININQRINSNTQSANIDQKYGPYSTLNEAKNAIVPSGGNLTVDNGMTFGVVADNIVTEYAFKGITQYTTVAGIRESFEDYIEKKVNDTKVVLKKADGTVIGYFTLNQAANGDIEITIPGDEQVQANWNESDSTAKSYIQNKPANIVYFEDVANTDK